MKIEHHCSIHLFIILIGLPNVLVCVIITDTAKKTSAVRFLYISIEPANKRSENKRALFCIKLTTRYLATRVLKHTEMSQPPNFPPFAVHSGEQSAGIRWRRWVEKFENMICALDITVDKRKKALLLHYVGEETYDIYDSFTDEQKGIGATILDGENVQPNEYNVLKQSLTDYFTPKKNTTYEVFKFRQATQNVGESIDAYHTRLRTLASTCDFHDNDREIT